MENICKNKDMYLRKGQNLVCRKVKRVKQQKM